MNTYNFNHITSILYNIIIVINWLWHQHNIAYRTIPSSLGEHLVQHRINGAIQGRPTTVSSLPLGLPLLGTFGGSLMLEISINNLLLNDYNYDYYRIPHSCVLWLASGTFIDPLAALTVFGLLSTVIRVELSSILLLVSGLIRDWVVVASKVSKLSSSSVPSSVSLSSMYIKQ